MTAFPDSRGTYDSPAVVSAVETEMERRVSDAIMHGGAKPEIRTVDAGDALITQGDMAVDVYLILDGILVVEVDGREVAEIGPGAVVGERAAREGGVRTATLRAVTRVRAARTTADAVDAADRGAVAATHHREDAAAV